MPDIKPYEEKEEDFIHFKLRRQDGCKFFMYWNKLDKILEQKNLIGAKSIHDKMIALFMPREEEIETYYDNIIRELTGNVISHFINDKGYTFEVKKRVKNKVNDPKVSFRPKGEGTSKTRIITYTSQDMISQAVSSAVYTALSKETNKENKDRKEQVLKKSYLNIINYVSAEKELSKIITHYKATVISGYIAMQFGFTLSADLKPLNIKEVPPTNEQIYNAVKYFTASLNPANKKKKSK